MLSLRGIPLPTLGAYVRRYAWLVAVVALVAVSSTLPEMLFILFLGYALSGYVLAAWGMTRRNRGSKPPPAPS